MENVYTVSVLTDELRKFRFNGAASVIHNRIPLCPKRAMSFYFRRLSGQQEPNGIALLVLGRHNMGRKRQYIPPPVIAIFGRISIERGYCKYCKSEAFIKDGCLLCCGAIAPKKPTKYKRVSDTSQRRKKPSPEAQQRILLEQLFKCFYCDKPFGALQARGRESFLLEVTWDHRLPYVLFNNSDDDNFVAACQICNSLKRDIVFSTVEDARFYLAHQRLKKGFNF